MAAGLRSHCATEERAHKQDWQGQQEQESSSGHARTNPLANSPPDEVDRVGVERRSGSTIGSTMHGKDAICYRLWNAQVPTIAGSSVSFPFLTRWKSLVRIQ